jgi:hypothetical protein
MSRRTRRRSARRSVSFGTGSSNIIGLLGVVLLMMALIGGLGVFATSLATTSTEPEQKAVSEIPPTVPPSSTPKPPAQLPEGEISSISESFRDIDVNPNEYTILMDYPQTSTPDNYEYVAYWAPHAAYCDTPWETDPKNKYIAAIYPVFTGWEEESTVSGEIECTWPDGTIKTATYQILVSEK